MKTKMLFALLASAVGLNAATIDLISSGAGTYNYGLTLPIGTTVSFNQNQQITFSGMSGVTGESATGDFFDFTNCGFTATTACFAQTASSFIFGNSAVSPSATFRTLTITSTVLTTGLINYSMQTSTGVITGQVLGPVPVTTAAPEPGTLAMLALGGFGLAFIRRYLR